MLMYRIHLLRKPTQPIPESNTFGQFARGLFCEGAVTIGDICNMLNHKIFVIRFRRDLKRLLLSRVRPWPSKKL